MAMPPKVLTEAQKKARAWAREQNTRLILQRFDQLPDSAHVRLPVLSALRGCSVATVWRHCRMGLLPAPIKMSAKITVWNVGELREALNAPHPANTIDPAAHARDALMAKRAAAAAGAGQP